MATAIRLQHPTTGMTKIGYYGFSWTSLLFGGIPALLRGDVGIGLGMIAIGMAAGFIGVGLGWFIVGIIWAFIYNKIHTTRLIEAGYKLADAPERVRDAQRALGIGDQAVL
ncbi:hypothetical protein [Rhizobium sp. 9140]|uniref:hypothetical protein n=1 Tax=Rhizobium sp. 9140 TaxID=1761900 RepID=UPI0007977A8A|nr:hypothetical protein [Rhizobium sp. 9140]CZT33374.1 hypothetical protein GA0004734_00003990 [Rhizobium sp. 9140]